MATYVIGGISKSKAKDSVMSEAKYEVMQDGGVPIKSWTLGVPFEDKARNQLKNISRLPFIHKWVAAMPDVHLGKGATIGSVVPTIGAVVPAAVGVDIGCGMMAVKTSLVAKDLPDNLFGIRSAIEAAVPHGRSSRGRGGRDKGAWANAPDDMLSAWLPLMNQFDVLKEKHRVLKNTNNLNHLGTLGTGNHFIEMCLDEHGSVWLMLHSGSRGVGNRIGTHFIELAKKDMERWHIQLPDSDLAYLPEGSEHFDQYVEAVDWAQNFARINREVMMTRVIAAVKGALGRDFEARLSAVNCHHNYISRENHYGKNVIVTRKGAVRAREGEMGIIPGSMGAKSFIVRGLGNEESFCSCSHGAGRVMSRTQAKKVVSLSEHKLATADVECRKDESVIDETPSAYKPIEKVMAAQKDLVEVVYTLKQVVCVKG
ncbi:MAG: tRNA-splicing ligase RtcB [Flavobacteriales bacterium]|jgi:tRNA-splicing ligase RtcB